MSRHEMHFSHRGRAVTAEEWVVAGLGGLSAPVGSLPFNFVAVCTPCALMSASFQTCLCVCVKFQKVGRRRTLPFEGC